MWPLHTTTNIFLFGDFVHIPHDSNSICDQGINEFVRESNRQLLSGESNRREDTWRNGGKKVVGVRWLSDGPTNGIKIIPFVCLSQVRVAGGLSDGQTNGIGVKIIHSSVCRSCVWLATRPASDTTGYNIIECSTDRWTSKWRERNWREILWRPAPQSTIHKHHDHDHAP
jgi:hypothetical protein